MGRNTNSTQTSGTAAGTNLTAAVVTYIAVVAGIHGDTTTTDDEKAALVTAAGESLQSTYGAIAPAARGNAQLAAMPTAMAAGTEIATAILDLFTNLPTATSRTEKVTLDESQSATVLIAAVVRLLVEMLGFTPTAEMTEILTNGRNTAALVTADTFSTVCTAVQRKLETVAVGAGTVTSKIRLPALVTAGTIPAGATLTGTNSDGKAVSGTVTADGKVTSKIAGKAVTGAVSTVAKQHNGSEISGYVFWSYNGARLDTYQS